MEAIRFLLSTSPADTPAPATPAVHFPFLEELDAEDSVATLLVPFFAATAPSLDWVTFQTSDNHLQQVYDRLKLEEILDKVGYYNEVARLPCQTLYCIEIYDYGPMWLSRLLERWKVNLSRLSLRSSTTVWPSNTYEAIANVTSSPDFFEFKTVQEGWESRDPQVNSKELQQRAKLQQRLASLWQGRGVQASYS